MKRKILVLLAVVIIAGLNCSNVFSGGINDFTLNSLDGKTYTLSSLYPERPVLMVFWATWCPYCVGEIPTLKELSSTYGDKVYILGIDIGEKPEMVRRFADRKGINYTVLLDTTAEVARSYEVRGIPLNIVVDTGGNVVYRGHSIREARKKLLSLTGHN